MKSTKPGRAKGCKLFWVRRADLQTAETGINQNTGFNLVAIGVLYALTHVGLSDYSLL